MASGRLAQNLTCDNIVEAKEVWNVLYTALMCLTSSLNYNIL